MVVLIENTWMGYLVFVDENIITYYITLSCWNKGKIWDSLIGLFFPALFPLYMSPSIRSRQADIADTGSSPEIVKNLCLSCHL